MMSSIGRRPRRSCSRQDAGEIARHVRDLGVGLGAPADRRRGVAVVAGLGEQLLRVERRDVGGKFGGRQRQIGGRRER